MVGHVKGSQIIMYYLKTDTHHMNQHVNIMRRLLLMERVKPVHTRFQVMIRSLVLIQHVRMEIFTMKMDNVEKYVLVMKHYQQIKDLVLIQLVNQIRKSVLVVPVKPVHYIRLRVRTRDHVKM